MVVSNIFYFHPYLGKIPNLTNIFQLGWNHQPEYYKTLLPWETPGELGCPGFIRSPGLFSHHPCSNLAKNRWFLEVVRYLVFNPPGDMIQFDEHIFQLGWWKTANQNLNDIIVFLNYSNYSSQVMSTIRFDNCFYTISIYSYYIEFISMCMKRKCRKYFLAMYIFVVMLFFFV